MSDIMRIPSGGGEIYAVHEPGCGDAGAACGENSAGCGSRPLVIMCHGLMMHCGQNPMLGMSEGFVKAGYDTLRFDFRGSGRSSGDIAEMTPLTEAEDLMAVIRYVQGSFPSGPDAECGSRAAGAGRRIVLCGHSLGGLVSLLVAARMSMPSCSNLPDAFSGMPLRQASAPDNGGHAVADSPIAGLILLAPAVNIETDSKAGRVALETFDPDNIPETIEVWGSRLGRNYFKTAQNLNVFETISACHCPACVIMGDRDRLVTLNFAEHIQKALPQAEMHVIPRGDHLFSKGLRLRASAIAIDFLSDL